MAVFSLHQIAEMILENGADPHISDHMGHTALHRAASKGNVNMVKLLLSRMADLDQRDSTGSTALYVCVLFSPTKC